MNRRDFLKLLSILPPAICLPPTISFPQNSDGEQLNILILIFDSWSASNTSLYGYPRKTTPNIDRLAEKAIVYHNHYASGHYTYPSTASLLTGVLPWTHKGYWDNPKGQILAAYNSNNLFSHFSSHFRTGYSHNALANSLLLGMSEEQDNFVPRNRLAIPNNQWFEVLFRNDRDISLVSWVRTLEIQQTGHANSLFLSRLYSYDQQKKQAEFTKLFPRGLPALTDKDNFILETAIDWIIENNQTPNSPYISYVHLLPPHSPYNTRADYIDAFKDDGYKPIKKPRHPFYWKDFTYEIEVEDRRKYDEFLLYVDSEFKRLMDSLSENGNLDNTIVVLTSDHGEMFERGIPEHLIPTFHNPLMHIPLLIFMPGQKERIDINSITTTVDLLPTLLHLTGKPIPDGLEGALLPPFNPNIQTDRTIFSMDFKQSPKFGPATDGTIMMRKGPFKLSYLFGTQKYYSKLDDNQYFELFDIVEDPEELINLFDRSDPVTRDLLDEMNTKLSEKNLLSDNMNLNNINPEQTTTG